MLSKIKHYIIDIASFQNGLHNPFFFKLVSILNTESGNFLRNELRSLLILRNPETFYAVSYVAY